MENKTEFLIGQLKYIASIAMSNAKRAHYIICSDDPNETAIVGYLNRANGLFNSARAIYISNCELLEHVDIEKFFNQFDIFVSEVLKNIATSHSQQWSDIEFEALQESFDCCVLSQ